MKPRILYIDHTAKMGGGEIALMNLVQALDRDRYTPVVLLFSEGPLDEKLRAAGVEVHVFLLTDRIVATQKDSLGLNTLLKITDVFRAMAFTVRLAVAIRRLKVALVHTNSLKADVLGGMAAWIVRVPLIWHVRDRIEEDYLPPVVVRIFRSVCRVLPDFVIANSNATLETLSLPDGGQMAAIPSGILVADQRIVHDGLSPAPPAAPRKGNEYSRVGLVGRIAKWKGQDVFLRAAREVLEAFPDTRFVIIGSALFSEQRFEDEVKQLATALGLDGHVEFLGFREDVPDLVRELDILVHASVTGEPFGQVVVEGMLAAKPVVATKGGGIPEIVVDGVTGILVPMGDSTAMAKAVGQLLSDPERAKEMGRLGRERVLQQFTIDRTAGKVMAVYDSLLNKGER